MSHHPTMAAERLNKNHDTLRRRTLKKNFTMKLNARLQTAQNPLTEIPIVLIHGLFGSLDNLGVLARGLTDSYHILQVDLRNHGLSPRAESMSYSEQAQDIIDTLDACNISYATLIGHSMGGKVAMIAAALAPQRISGLTVIDTAPVDYRLRRHEDVFAAVKAVSAAGATTRREALNIMNQHIAQPAVSQFLLKSFCDGEWRFNVPVLWREYPHIIGWEEIPAWPHPALFISGGTSPYIQPEYQNALMRQFPNATIQTIPGAGHWVHAEKPLDVLKAIQPYLSLIPLHA